MGVVSSNRLVQLVWQICVQEDEQTHFEPTGCSFHDPDAFSGHIRDPWLSELDFSVCAGLRRAPTAAAAWLRGSRARRHLVSTSITIKDEDGNAVGIGGPTKVDVTQAEVENAAHLVSHLLLSPGRCWRRLPYIRRSPAGGCAATLHGCSALHRPAAVHRPTAPPWSIALLHMTTWSDEDTPDFRFL